MTRSTALPRLLVVLALPLAGSTLAPHVDARQPVSLDTFTLLPSVAANTPMTASIAAVHGASPYKFALVNPPSGWSITADGSLSGTPRAGLSMVSVLVTDASGGYDQRLYEVWGADPSTPVGVGDFPTLQPAAIAQSYALRLYPSGGVAPFQWSLAGASLPPGIALAGDGMLAGSPTKAGSFAFTVTVTDASGKSAQAQLTLRVDDTSAPLALGVDPTHVLRSATPRIGLNVFDQRTYWSDVGLTNMLLANPGFEHQTPLRRMYLAQTGDAGSVQSEPLYDNGDGDFPTGTFDGGNYWILSGPAKGRAGTIGHFTRTEVSGGQFTGTWTFDDSNASQVVRTATTQDPLDADIFLVEEPARPVLPGWAGRNLGSTATVSADGSVYAAGSQSARLDSSTAADVAISQTFLLQNPWARLRKDTTYGFSVDVRQHGLASGTVHVRVGTPFPQPAFFDQAFQVPDDGQFHHLTGTLQGGNQADAAFDVAITDSGTIWVDDAMLWEAQATTTRPHGAASSPVASEPFAPLPYVVQELKDAQVGCVRAWYYGTDLTLTEALRKPTAADPAPAHNLYGDLNLAETIGAKAWIVAAREWMADDFAQLAEYLASPDTTKGRGALRAQQGHPKPWTDTLAHVYIEYSDESWNWPNFAYPYDMWHPSKYSEAAQDRFGAIKSSPYYKNMTLVLDGQARDDYWVNKPLDQLTYPAHDAMDNAPYVGASTAWPSSELGSELLGQYAAFAHDLPATLAMFQAQGHATKLLVYEGGPGVGAYNAAVGEDNRKNAMGTAATYVDSVGDLFENGIDEYNTFLYQDGAWKATTGETSRFRMPEFYALSMFNAAAGGGDEVAVTMPADAPTITPFDDTNAANGRVAGTPVPIVSARAYVNGGHTSWVLVNRSHAAAYSVSVPTHETAPLVVTTLAAADADRGALTGPGLVTGGLPENTDASQVDEAAHPVVTTEAPKAGRVTVTLAPAAVVTVTDAPPPSAGGDAGADAGAPGIDGSAGLGGQGGDDAGATAATPGDSGNEGSGGCACSLPASSQANDAAAAAGSLAVALALVTARARRRRGGAVTSRRA